MALAIALLLLTACETAYKYRERNVCVGVCILEDDETAVEMQKLPGNGEPDGPR